MGYHFQQNQTAGGKRINHEETLYKNSFLFISAGAVGIGRLCRRGAAAGNHNNHRNARGNNDWPGNRRSSGDPGPAGASDRDTDSLAWSEVCLDTWVLALDRSGLRVGARQLGRAATSDRSVGRRPLGAQIPRLGVDRGPLAIAKIRFRVFAR